MKMLSRGDGRVVKTVQKQRLTPEKAYRLSSYCLVHETEGAALLKNTLTRQAAALSPAEWAAARAGDLSGPAAQELARLRFLVEEDYDEYAAYMLALRVLRSLEKREAGIESYTILPTTGCNARCVYCYEEGWRTSAMTEETADAVAAFIVRTKRAGSIHIKWYGGEPLCAPQTVSRICRALREKDVAYESSIITNATLLTPALADEAVGLWKLRYAQVSLDGARADYEARKRYLNPRLHNYDAAMAGAALLAERGVKVTLRCNFDAENLPGLPAFFADCAERFGGFENVGGYLEQLFQSSGTENGEALYRAAEEAAKRAAGLRFSRPGSISESLKTHHCIADSGGKGVVIDPSGGLYLCEHMSGKPFATIRDEEIAFPHLAVQTAESCRTCPFLPDCTPFRKTGCPVKNTACRTQMELLTVRELEKLYRDGEGEAEDAPEGGCS